MQTTTLLPCHTAIPCRSRTTLYATYARVSNDANSNLGFGGPGNGTFDETASGVAVGVQHNF